MTRRIIQVSADGVAVVISKGAAEPEKVVKKQTAGRQAEPSGCPGTAEWHELRARLQQQSPKDTGARRR